MLSLTNSRFETVYLSYPKTFTLPPHPRYRVLLLSRRHMQFASLAVSHSARRTVSKLHHDVRRTPWSELGDTPMTAPIRPRYPRAHYVRLRSHPNGETLEMPLLWSRLPPLLQRTLGIVHRAAGRRIRFADYPDGSSCATSCVASEQTQALLSWGGAHRHSGSSVESAQTLTLLDSTREPRGAQQSSSVSSFLACNLSRSSCSFFAWSTAGCVAWSRSACECSHSTSGHRQVLVPRID